MSNNTNGSDPSRIGGLRSKDVKYLVVHCSATKPSMNIGAAEIDRWHRQKGWRKIGYHFVIKRDGTIEPGRGLTEIGAHAAGYNSVSIGICLVGGVSEQDVKKAENNFTIPQMESLHHLLSSLLDASFPKAKVLGHRDLPGVAKDCPSFDVQKWFYGVN
jgi:N-acetylmuramoyl-L-alanine amidase